jgi:hypothetical protein
MSNLIVFLSVYPSIHLISARTGSFFSDGICGMAINPSLPIDGFMKAADGKELRRYSPKSLYYWTDKTRMWLENHMQVTTRQRPACCCRLMLVLFCFVLF